MVSHDSDGREEPQSEKTISLSRKPSAEPEGIDKRLGSDDLHELITAMEALELQGAEAVSLLRAIAQRDAWHC